MQWDLAPRALARWGVRALLVAAAVAAWMLLTGEHRAGAATELPGVTAALEPVVDSPILPDALVEPVVGVVDEVLPVPVPVPLPDAVTDLPVVGDVLTPAPLPVDLPPVLPPAQPPAAGPVTAAPSTATAVAPTGPTDPAGTEVTGTADPGPRRGHLDLAGADDPAPVGARHHDPAPAPTAPSTGSPLGTLTGTATGSTGTALALFAVLGALAWAVVRGPGQRLTTFALGPPLRVLTPLERPG